MRNEKNPKHTFIVQREREKEKKEGKKEGKEVFVS